MSERDDILVRLRYFRDMRGACSDRTLVSEAIAEIIELRGRAVQAENRATHLAQKLDHLNMPQLFKPPKEEEPEVKPADVGPARSRAIRIP